MDETRTDADWEYLGRHDPYWGVATDDRFHRHNLNDDALREFFAAGEEYVGRFFQIIRSHLDGQFAPRRALDFGCGVGRLVVALARRCPAVVGVDVSASMLREARANCRARGVDNVSFVPGDDRLAGVTGTFDLITSFVVFQHIPCRRGRVLFRRLVELLADGGVGVLHVTYSHAAFGPHLEAEYATWPPQPPPAPPPDGFWHHLAGLRRAVRRRLARTFGANGHRSGRHAAPGLHSHAAAPEYVPGPRMQMIPYLLNPLFHVLQEAGVRQVHVELTDHGGYFGQVLFFRKQAGAPYRA